MSSSLLCQNSCHIMVLSNRLKSTKFQNGSCPRNQHDCWYVHMLEDEHSTESEHKCFACGIDFGNMYELMNHKKKNHPSDKPCSKYEVGECVYTAEKCWYSHDAQTQPKSPIPSHRNDNQSQDFWPPLQNPNPPPQIQQIMTMMMNKQTQMMGEMMEKVMKTMMTTVLMNQSTK